MSPRVEALVAAAVLALCAAWSPALNALWLIPVLVVALPTLLVWRFRDLFGVAALAGAGAVLGLAAHGLAQPVFFVLAWRRGESPLWLLTGAFVASVPFALVAWVLAQTGWGEESALALAFASAASSAFLVAVWGRSWMGRDLRWIPAAIALLAVVMAAVTLPGEGPAVPAHAALTRAQDPVERLHDLLRRRAAGDPRAGYAAAGHWVTAFGADLDTLRFVCPRHGLFPGREEAELVALGERACRAAGAHAEEALEIVGDDPRLQAIASELRASLGVVEAGAPQWLLATYGRASSRPEGWDAFNRRLDFREPLPAKRRGLRGMGPGRLLVAPAHDLGSFALTSITKRGGLRYYVDVPTPAGPPPRRLTLVGASRRGLRLELQGGNGEVLRWGCQGEPSPEFVPMPDAFCAGEPGTVTLELAGRLSALDTIRIRGEFAIRSLHGS